MRTQTSTALADLMHQRLPVVGSDIDEWTRQMMRWHFSETTGSPFWLSRKPLLSFDPISDITCFDDLKLFGYFNKEDLRSADVRALIPRGLHDRPFRVFETGGTTGEPCRVANVSKLDQEVVMYRAMLEFRGLVGGDMVAMTPAGPHQYAHFVARLADTWNGAVGFIDFDPRWVKRELQAGSDGAGYVQHLVHQTLPLLARLRPAFLFTTSKLLLELVTRLDRPLSDYGVKAVCTGGTSCTPEEVRFLNTEYLQGIHWIDTYGNTLVGHCLMAEPQPGTATRTYHIPLPLARVSVVDPEAPDQQVDFGQRGRVLATTLLKDLFLPNLLERDSAIRVPPNSWYPWEGVADVQPFIGVDQDAIYEGVY